MSWSFLLFTTCIFRLCLTSSGFQKATVEKQQRTGKFEHFTFHTSSYNWRTEWCNWWEACIQGSPNWPNTQDNILCLTFNEEHVWLMTTQTYIEMYVSQQNTHDNTHSQPFLSLGGLAPKRSVYSKQEDNWKYPSKRIFIYQKQDFEFLMIQIFPQI